MPPGLLQLPFDVLHSIAVSLDIRSYVNLSDAHKHLFQLLLDESISRCVVQANLSHFRDAQLASTNPQLQSYHQALFRTCQRWEAVRTATPCSASILAHATSFAYQEGILCYTTNVDLRILSLKVQDRLERVISGKIFSSLLHSSHDRSVGSNDKSLSLSVLNYSYGIVALLCETVENPGPWLIALDVRDFPKRQQNEPRSRLLFRHRIGSSNRLFVRNNAEVLYYGSHSALGSHGHHEWLIHGVDLTTGKTLTPKPLQFTGFVGSELGATVAFAIHGGCFYAVSNQSSYESEEVDWTSYYQYVRFPLEGPNLYTTFRSVYRRQHREGPINDAWSHLSLQVDPKTNELLIIECRKEWLGGGSTSIRTYYTEPLKLDEAEGLDFVKRRPTHPPNDPLARTMDSTNNSKWEEERTRIKKHVHREYSAVDTPDPSRVFIRAKTKFHTYNSAANSFIDLVLGTVSTPGSTRPRERLRLRVASRIPQSPLVTDPDNAEHFKTRARELDREGQPIPDSEEDFTPTEIYMWPPDDAPAELFDILCPGTRAGSVDAIADDRNIIYQVGPANDKGERAIVMLSFDCTWCHSGLTRMQRHKPSSDPASSISVEKKDKTGIPVHLKRKNESEQEVHQAEEKSLPLPDWSSTSDSGAKRQKCEAGSSTSMSLPPATSAGTSSSNVQRLVRKEEAMYLSINRGFWLR